MNDEETTQLGTFEVTGGDIMATDPCYDRGTWCQRLVPAKNGRWLAIAETGHFDSWGRRTISLRVYHEDYGGAPPSEVLEGDFGVDSSQFGFYDGSRYPRDPGSYSDPESWYRKVCDVHAYDTTNHVLNGMVDEGPVASSGFGDGSYVVLVEWDDATRPDRRAVALEAVFISEEEDEEEYGDDEGDDEEEDDEIEQEPEAGAA